MKKNTATKKKSAATANIFSVVSLVLAWAVEAVGGLFYPLILIIGACFIPTDNGNLLADIPGFPLVLAGLGAAVLFMLAGLILYHLFQKKESRRSFLPFLFMIVAAVLFIAVYIGISKLCINENSAVSMDARGNLRLTQIELIWRHGIPVVIPLLVLLSRTLKQVAADRQLFDEAIREIQEKGKKPVEEKD